MAMGNLWKQKVFRLFRSSAHGKFSCTMFDYWRVLLHNAMCTLWCERCKLCRVEEHLPLWWVHSLQGLNCSTPDIFYKERLLEFRQKKREPGLSQCSCVCIHLSIQLESAYCKKKSRPLSLESRLKGRIWKQRQIAWNFQFKKGDNEETPGMF